MKLSILKIKKLWENLQKKLDNQQFSPTKFIDNEPIIKTKILALFSKTGQNINQLQDIGFVICNQNLFAASSNETVSDKGKISNDYFSCEIIDVNNTIIPNVYIHLVKIDSGPVVINEIPVRMYLDETYHQGLMRNKLALKLFLIVLKNKINNFESFTNTFVDNKKITILIKTDFKLLKKEVLNVLIIINNILKQELSQLQQNNDFAFLKTFKNKDLDKLLQLEQLTIMNVRKDKAQWKLVLMCTKEQIESTFSAVKKPIIKKINIFNKKIRLINQPEIIQEVKFSTIVRDYEQLVELMLIYKKIKNNFNKWRKNSNSELEKLTDLLMGGYYSETFETLKINHLSFNHELLDENLLKFKGRKLLSNTNNTILFLSNNIVDNPIMIILISDNLKLILNLDVIINSVIKKPIKKILYNDGIILINADSYQAITDIFSNIVAFLKKGTLKSIENYQS